MALPYTEIPSDGSTLLTSCQRACPVGTDVSSYIALIVQGRFEDAIAVVREENPFPGICGRVCDHQCESYCRRRESDAPVSIRALKRFLADRSRLGNTPWPEQISAWRAEMVAVIGSGPAGLTAASDLVRTGFSVTVFEALPVAGGMMRVGIPDYRLPPEVLDYDIEYLRKLGVRIETNAMLGRDFTLGSLKERGFDAVVLATGAHGSRRLNLLGEDLSGVIHGIDFLRKVKLNECSGVGPRAVVIGGGDVAMDTARTALREGATKVDVFCLESRDEMPASEEEISEALEENIELHCGWGPVEIIGDTRVRQVRFVRCTSVFDENGRFSPTFDQSESIDVDTDSVLPAIGQYAVFSHAPSDGIETTQNRLYQVNQATLQTTAPWVFAAGDAVTGTQTVIKAVASGHRVAASAVSYLGGKPLEDGWHPKQHMERVERPDILQDWEERPRAEEPKTPAVHRTRSFIEVSQVLSKEAAVVEAERCMRCDAETRSYTYSRIAREQIYHLARDIGRNERSCLAFLQLKLCESNTRRRPLKHDCSLDDLVFLPANLTRLVIDPYREPCKTETVIGARSARPLKLRGPLFVGGLCYSRLPVSVNSALCRGTVEAGVGLRAAVGESFDHRNLKVIQVVPLEAGPEVVRDASAIELQPSDPGASVDAELLQSRLSDYRKLVPDIPLGLTIWPGNVAVNIRMAVEAGLDFVTLSGVAPESSSITAEWREDHAVPEIGVLTDAVESLRAINREEDIDILYYGGIRSGADVARALSLGANAVMIGQAARIAVESGIQTSDVDSDAGRLANLVNAFLLEASMLARCCGKTDVHNLEPEDLRSLTTETALVTGALLVGSDCDVRACT